MSKKSFLSVLLVLVMVIGIFPVQVLATGDEPVIISQGTSGDLTDDGNGENTSPNSYVLYEDGTLVISGTGTVSLQFAETDFAEQIKTVRIGSGITRIGERAFMGCSNIESVYIPASVERIDSYAFYRCTSLNNLNLSEGLLGFGLNSFTDCTALQTLNVPASVMIIGKDSFYGCSSLETVTVAQNSALAAIQDEAFYECRSLTKVSIPDSGNLFSIGYAAFRDCIALNDLTLPGKLTALRDDAFRNCGSLTKITIPAGVTEIDQEVFLGCTAVTDVYIYANPDNLTWRETDNKSFAPSTVIHVDDEYYPAFINKFGPVLDPHINIVNTSTDPENPAPSYCGTKLWISGTLDLAIGIDPNGCDMTGATATYKIGNADPVTGVTCTQATPGNIYFFLCPISSVQMGDKITATLTYGDKTVDLLTDAHNVTLENYLNSNTIQSNQKTKALADSMLRYGYYAQRYLSATNGWTVGDKYSAMDGLYAYEDLSSKISSVTGSLSDYGAAVVTGDFRTYFPTISMKLFMDNTLGMRLTLTSDGKHSYNLRYATGSTTALVPCSDHTYTADYSNIYPTQMGVRLAVADGSDSFAISINDYIKIMLGHTGDNLDDMKGTMCALYEYGQAAQSYVSTH